MLKLKKVQFSILIIYFNFLNILYILYGYIVTKTIKYQAMRVRIIYDSKDMRTIKYQAMRVRIIYDSKNQTIGNDARQYFLDCAHKQADKSE